jgi:hypothetical protein
VFEFAEDKLGDLKEGSKKLWGKVPDKFDGDAVLLNRKSSPKP